MSDNKEKIILEHAKEVIHKEEVGDHLRTGRSAVYTKLGAVRQHDQGKQELAHKVVHHKEPTDVEKALQVEHEIEHVHEHRTTLSGFTL